MLWIIFETKNQKENTFQTVLEVIEFSESYTPQINSVHSVFSVSV